MIVFSCSFIWLSQIFSPEFSIAYNSKDGFALTTNLPQELIMKIFIVSFLLLPVVSADEVTCDQDPPDSNSWKNCRNLQQATKKRVVCDCSKCPEVKRTMSCNERGYWEPDDDFYARTEECLNCLSRSIQLCPSHLTCKRNKKKSQTCRCYYNCQKNVQSCGDRGNPVTTSNGAWTVCFAQDGFMEIPTATEETFVRWRIQERFSNYNGNTSVLLECINTRTTIKNGSVSCIGGKLIDMILPECEKSNFISSLLKNKYFIISTALLGCAFLICTIYVTVKKVQKHRMPLPRADDEEVLYDEIDLRYVVEPPVPEPPPRVHDGHGYLLVKEPYQYDVVGEEKTLEKWIKPIAEVSDDVEQDNFDQEPASYEAEVPENEDLMLHKPEVPEDVDLMLHQPEIPKDVNKDPLSCQLEDSEYVDHNDLHRYKTKMPYRPKLSDYVNPNDLEQYQVKFSHQPKGFKDVDQNDGDQFKISDRNVAETSL